MLKFKKRCVVKHTCQAIAVLLAICLMIPMSVSAVPDSSESEGIYTSMYDVSTALTSYANNVVGSNTNDKHDDHMLREMRIGSSLHPGIAGAFIGYGDEDKDFYAYISSNTAKSVTTSSYDAWLNVGDDGSIYAYARYGHLLADLGLDETGDAAGSSMGRTSFGLFMQGTHAVSSFIPKVFDTSLTILKTLNPFQFFTGTVTLQNPDTGTTISTDTNVKDAITQGSISGANSTVDGAGDTVNLTGNNELDANQTIGTSSAFTKLISYVSDIYSAARNMGMWVVFPMMLVMLLIAILFKRDTSGWKSFAFKFAFMCIGIPLCGMLYTAVLDNMTTVTQKTPAASKMVACTFVDFQSWVQSSRLDLPNGVTLISVGENSSDGDSITAAGSAHTNTVKQLRNITYKLNDKIYGFPSNFDLGITTSTTTNPGMWDTNGELRNNTTDSTTEKQVNAMLQRYRSGDFYQASTWETAVNGAISKYHRSDLGQIPSTANASTNDGKIYQMYDETNEVSDWMNRTVADNKKILNGTLWSAFNIFSNGKLKVTAPSGTVTTTGNLNFTGSGVAWGDKSDPSTSGGLSSVAMYNYLSSSFGDSAISVYSAQKSTSEYTKQAHYSVNLIGSGALRFAYGLNCIACLFAFALIGIVYGFGMVIGNIKRGISLIMQVPFAVMGVIRSIIQVVIYVFVMCVELIFSVFAYKWVCELIVLFASIIESPIEVAVTSNIILGGRFAFLADYISPAVLADNRMVFTVGMFVLIGAVIFGNYKFLAHNRAVLTAYEYAVCRYMRMVTFKQMLPVFDAWMAQRSSLYVWDSVSEITDVVSETVQNVGTVEIDLQKGVPVV